MNQTDKPDTLTSIDTSSHKINNYWKKNLKIMSALLFCWFFFSLGCGVLWVDYLNQYTIPGTGFKLGFWFAQQGSVIAFVFIVLIYALMMNRADKEENNANLNSK
jgi:putative solute:sodium symporter small subunit